MASSSDIPGDVLTTAHEGPHGETVSADVPPGLEETVPEPLHLPDIYNLEWQRQGMPDTEFNRKYPPDPWGEEAAPNARVWKVYRDRQTTSDRAVFDSWNKTLDVLLIFAGLFSAVSTTFLIESYKTLQPDYTQYVAAFLYAAAVSHNRTGGAFPSLDTIGAPEYFVQTSSTQRWTNGLWFSSLVISLAVALLCILIKQWLDEYDSHTSSATASQQYGAQRHWMYYHGLNKWGLPGLISFLPLLLHLSLFLFFVGLILFLRPLDSAISYSILVMVSCIATFYVLSLCLPAWHIECPSYTPLLAHAMLTVSRAIGGLIYIIQKLNPHRVTSYRVLRRFYELACRALSHLYWIKRRTMEHRHREAQTISPCDRELDGYVLRALVDLPTDTNQDVINTALVAIGAISAIRTIDVISRNLSDDDFQRKLYACFHNLPSEESGFTMSSSAQLRRAYHAMTTRYPRYSPHQFTLSEALTPCPSLGIDGMLLMALNHRRYFLLLDINLLIHQLQSLPLSKDRSCGFPLREMCIFFLDQFSERAYPAASVVSCLLLVFCAGRFAGAERRELVYALDILCRRLSIITRTTHNEFPFVLAYSRFPITRPEHNDDVKQSVCAGVNSLWNTLSNSTRHNVDTLTAQIVARQAIACFEVGFPYACRCPWANLSGLSSFVRSPAFEQCAGSGDTLALYISLFARLADCAQVSPDYWICIATLSKLSWECVPRPEQAVHLAGPHYPFPLEPTSEDILSISGEGRPQATQDDRYELALPAFLEGPTAIASWTCAIAPDHDDKHTFELAALANRISLVLCRRKHLGRDNDAYISGFFSGSFLLARFQDLVCRKHILGPDSDARFRQTALDLATHCLKLSPERFMGLLTQLEETGSEDSMLRAHAVDFAERIRSGRGELTAECSRDCHCMMKTQARGAGDI